MSGGRNKKDWDTVRFSNRVHSLREILISYEGDTQTVPIRPPDVSTRGMFINTSQKFPEGAVLNLRFCLDLSGAEVEARGEVRYCIPSVGIGVEFIAMSPKAIRAIEKEIELVRGKLPRRRTTRKKKSARIRA
jgi:PilZ domain